MHSFFLNFTPFISNSVTSESSKATCLAAPPAAGPVAGPSAPGGTAVPDGGTPVPLGGTAVPEGGTAVPLGGTAVPDGGTRVPVLCSSVRFLLIVIVVQLFKKVGERQI